MKNKTKGFTLIELLVVIAIIGILSSVVVASVSIARNRGMDAAIKTNLASIKHQTEILYNDLGCYASSGTCSGSSPTAFAVASCPTTNTSSVILRHPIIIEQLNAARLASSGSVSGLSSCASTAGGLAWAVAIPLKTDPSTAWCVDSLGISKVISNGGTPYTQASLNADIDLSACES